MRILTALAAASLLLAGCDDESKPSDGASSATASSQATSKPTASAARQVPTPEPLDTDELKKTLKCGNGGHGPCEVLQEFADCKEFSPITQSGDGRWMGTGYRVKKGKFTEEITVMRSRRVPLSDVGPGQLGAKISVDQLPDNNVAVTRHAPKAIRAFKRGDVPKQTNAAIDFILKKSDWHEAFTMQAKANQIYVAAHGGGYLCKKDQQRLLLVERAGNREHPADGVYAVLWPVSW